MIMLAVTAKMEFSFTGQAMETARRAMGLTQPQFADVCGWSKQNQQQLELPGIKHHVTDRIFTGLKNAGVTLKP